jgi:4-hydroxy-4-methyl-2-oxoglutarate aldolase
MTIAGLPADQFEALRQLSTCQIANAIEQFKVRLRNEGYTNSSLRCFFPRLGGMLGYAATLKVRSADPPVAGDHYLEHTGWWDHLRAIPQPRVLVIQDMDPDAGTGAFLGEVHVSILQALGCAGAVTNGAVRDLREVEQAGFHLFGREPAVSHAYMHVIEAGGTVEVAGLRIEPGDLLQADCHGVISIPEALASRVAAEAAAIEAREQQIISLCRSDEFSVERLRDLVQSLRQPIL